MINFRIIARVFSLVIIIEGFFMLLAAGVSFLYGERATLLYSSIITIVTGALVFTPLRNEEKLSGQKEGYIILSGIWILLSLFGTLPYLLGGTIGNFGDAFFESISGFTTTGATILTNIEITASRDTFLEKHHPMDRRTWIYYNINVGAAGGQEHQHSASDNGFYRSGSR